MNELENHLNNVSDAYPDFIEAVLDYANEKQSNLNSILNYMNNNHYANSSDILLFISLQPGFFDDAVYDDVS